MPTRQGIQNILARTNRPGRTLKWRRYPARSGFRPPPVVPAPQSAEIAAVDLNADGSGVIALRLRNRTSHPAAFWICGQATVDRARLELDGNVTASHVAVVRSGMFEVRVNHPDGQIILQQEVPVSAGDNTPGGQR